MGKVPTLAPFLLEIRLCGLYILDLAMEELDHSLSSIFMDSIKTLELDASFDEHDDIATSVSSVFFQSFSNLSDSSKLKPIHSIRAHNSWYQARVPLLSVSLEAKM